MRKIRYTVVMNLYGYYGYIAGPNGDADWIFENPEIDSRALYNQFDTILLGRR